MRRLFVAIEVPPEVRAGVEESFARWRAALPRARWVPPHNLHVTLWFIGPVRSHLVAEVSSAVEAAASTVGPFATRLNGVGAFPSAARARVLWAGLDDRAGCMATLALALDAELGAAFPPQVREFHPHLSVARCDPPVRLPDMATGIDLPPFTVSRAVLFESCARRGAAPRYEAMAAHPLAGDACGRTPVRVASPSSSAAGRARDLAE